MTPQLAYPTTGVNKEPKTEVYLNGKKHTSVRVSRITDSSGIEPAHIELLFPTRDYMEHPCDENDRIIVYVNRTAHPDPMFRGYVTGFGDFLTIESGQYVKVFGLDDMMMLNSDVCDRNYNIRNSRDEATETLTIKQIAADLQTQIRDTPGATPTIVTSSFPSDTPGEMLLLGTPFDAALMQILEEAGDDKWSIRRKYTNDSTYVYAFVIGEGAGEIADLRYCTDIASTAQNQPRGVANVGAARREVSTTDAVNAADIVCDRQVKETALTLTAAWPNTKEYMLNQLEIFTKKGTETAPNPDYDEDAERLGRAFRIGTVNQGRFSEYPELEPRLLQVPPFGYTNVADDFAKPFVVYQFSGESTYNITTNFQMKDNEVITAKPLIRDQATTGASVNPAIAASVWIEAAYKLRSPLVVTISKQGDVNRTVKRIFNRTDFKYKYQDAYFSIQPYTATNTTLNSTVTKFRGNWQAGSNIVQNDTTLASNWGIDRLRILRDARLEITYELPRMDMSYRVGQRVRENETLLDASIISIEYDLIAATTTITAASR